MMHRKELIQAKDTVSNIEHCLEASRNPEGSHATGRLGYILSNKLRTEMWTRYRNILSEHLLKDRR